MVVKRIVFVLRISLELYNVFLGKNFLVVKNVLKVVCVYLVGKEYYIFIIILYCIVNLIFFKVVFQIKYGINVKFFKII